MILDDKTLDLFPEFDKQTTYETRRVYVEERMIELAQQKRLRLTDLFSLPAPLPDLCGEVVLGRQLRRSEWNPEGYDSSPVSEIAHDVVSMPVRIQTLPGIEEEIVDEFSHTSEFRPWSVKCKLPPREITRYVRQPDGKLEPRIFREDRHHDAREDESVDDPCDVVVPASKAWWILKQWGAHCRPAKRKTMQIGRLEKYEDEDGKTKKRLTGGYWKCQEVPLDAPPRGSEQAKKRRGRPPKSAQGEAAAQ